jgi:regulation of enolase protein 1 (concanavalin A-like superfamily)
VPQQVFPLLQVAGGGRHGDQFAVGATRDRLAVHITDVTTEQRAALAADWSCHCQLPMSKVILIGRWCCST